MVYTFLKTDETIVPQLIEVFHLRTMKVTKMRTIMTRLIIVCLSPIVLGLISTGQSDAQHIESAAGVWLFDKFEAKDSSKNGKDAKIIGAKKVRGKFGKALKFDGIDDFVDCGNDSSLDITGEITIMMWAKVDAPTERYGNFLNRFTKWRSDGYTLRQYRNEGTVDFVTTAGGTDLQSKIAVTDGSWHHIAVTMANGVKRIYIDGALKSEKAETGAIASAGEKNLFIGKESAPNPAHWFKGILDEVAVFSKALTDNDIKNIMNDGIKKVVRLAVSSPGKLTTTWGSIKS